MDDIVQPRLSTLERLVELTREVDFAAFVFAQDDWTSSPQARCGRRRMPRGHSSIFKAGLFGGALGMRRTSFSTPMAPKLPTDLLGMTSVRYARGDQPGRGARSIRSSGTQSRTKVAQTRSRATGGSTR